MRKTLVEVERLLYSATPERHLEKCNKLFYQLLNLARDAEEAGEAALFVASALIYLRDGPKASAANKSKLAADLSNRSQALATVMLARRGQVEGRASGEESLPFTDGETRFMNRASVDGVLVFRPNEDAMVARLMGRGLLKSEADANPDFKVMSLTVAGYEALALSLPRSPWVLGAMT
ncbi:MAG: hypothetical protein JWL62_3835 [Hyphomicrobiales bacterium]|nr:hypothetical protein [Hyphomicrobiales bacterium]